MTPLTALRLLEHVQDTTSERLPVDALFARHPQTPINLAAVAELTGWLDELADDDVDGLAQAAEHGLACVDMGALTFDAWEDAVRELARQMICNMEDAPNGA